MATVTPNLVLVHRTENRLNEAISRRDDPANIRVLSDMLLDAMLVEQRGEWYEEQRQEAVRRGCCTSDRCLFRTYGFARVSFIKHRSGHPHLTGLPRGFRVTVRMVA